MLPLNVGAPALEEIVTLYFPSTSLRATLSVTQLSGVMKNAAIDTDKHYAAFRKDSLNGVHVYCGTFHRVSRQ